MAPASSTPGAAGRDAPILSAPPFQPSTLKRPSEYGSGSNGNAPTGGPVQRPALYIPSTEELEAEVERTRAQVARIPTVGPGYQRGPSGGLNSGSLNTGPLHYSGGLNTGPLVPKGALQLLSQESVAYQLGALYLTNKRVILLAPSVVRSAFVRDIDAVGTLTERASGWHLFGSVLLLAFAAGLVYAELQRSVLRAAFGPLYIVPPLLLAGILALAALFLAAKYFVWQKRSLFVSVKGRPLITVSMTDWKSSKLAGMDGFVNSFFEIKDLLTGELPDRPPER